jgi:hypothetical protein
MKAFLITLAVFLVYLGMPLAATLWCLYCYKSYKDALPFTEDEKSKKKSAIISAVIAGVFDTIFFIILLHYAFTCFF